MSGQSCHRNRTGHDSSITLSSSYSVSRPSLSSSSSLSSSDLAQCRFSVALPAFKPSAKLLPVPFQQSRTDGTITMPSTFDLSSYKSPSQLRVPSFVSRSSNPTSKMASIDELSCYLPNPFNQISRQTMSDAAISSAGRHHHPHSNHSSCVSQQHSNSSPALISPLPYTLDGACSLVWSNLTYSVSSFDLNVKTTWCPWRQTHRTILDGLSGHINSGELVALIGPSGVGKSSLLEILAGRRRQGVHGDVHLVQRSLSRHVILPPSSSSLSKHHHPAALQHSNYNRHSASHSHSHQAHHPHHPHHHHYHHHHNHHQRQLAASSFGGSMPEASISFISQHDHHLDMLTVRETLLYASQLKNAKRARQTARDAERSRSLPGSLPLLQDSSEFHKLLVHSVLNDLGLLEAQYTTVGRCSGGQRRRLSIAVELLSQPRLILMDEPTTGLDFVSAFKCIQTLRSLTLMPHPPGIITSIHQPSSVVLSQFHRVYTLAKGGRCMFEGQVHSLVPHLNDFRLRCPVHFNPADFAIQVASGEFGLSCVDQLAEHQRKCHEHAHQALKPLPTDRVCVTFGGQWTLTKRSFDKIRQQMNKPAGSIISQVAILIRRSWKCTWRQPTLSWLRIFQFAFIALLIANLHNYPVGQVNGCFSDLQPNAMTTTASSAFVPSLTTDPYDFDLDSNDTVSPSSTSTSVPPTPRHSISSWFDWIRTAFQDASQDTSRPSAASSSFDSPNGGEHYVQHLAKVKDNSILLFFSLMFWAMSSIVPTLLTFPAEMRVFRRERANGWYTCFSYYTAKILVDTPLITICPLLFCAVFYPLTGQLAEWWRFALFYSVAVLLCLIAQTLGLIVGAAFADDRLSAVFIGSLQSFPLFMVGGYLIRGSVVSTLVRPLWQFGYVRFAFSALILSVYGFDRCPAQPPSFVSPSSLQSAPLPPLSLQDGVQTERPFDSLLANDTQVPSSRALLHQVRTLMDEDDFNCLHDSYYTDAGYEVDQLLGRCNLSLPVLFARQPLESVVSPSNATIHENSFVLSYYEVSNDSFAYNMLYLLGTLFLLQFINYLLLVHSSRKEVHD